MTRGNRVGGMLGPALYDALHARLGLGLAFAFAYALEAELSTALYWRLWVEL